MQIDGNFEAFCHQGRLAGDPNTAKLTTSDPDGEDGKITLLKCYSLTVCSRLVCGMAEYQNEQWKIVLVPR